MTGVQIKHASYAKYMGVTESSFLGSNWPRANMSCDPYRFSITDLDGEPNDSISDLADGQTCKIKTHWTMHPNYEFAYSSESGWIYFDLQSYNEKQVWKLHKDGDRVAFENQEWPGWYLGVEDDWLKVEETRVWWTLEE